MRIQQLTMRIQQQRGLTRRMRSFAVGLRSFVLWLFEQIVALVRECNEAQRLAMQLRLSPEFYAADRDRAPDSYGEFLFRSPMALRHEPRARRPANTTR
jgi:hypothetical protein